MNLLKSLLIAVGVIVGCFIFSFLFFALLKWTNGIGGLVLILGMAWFFVHNSLYGDNE